jgi:hypothetical protein
LRPGKRPFRPSLDAFRLAPEPADVRKQEHGDLANRGVLRTLASP